MSKKLIPAIALAVLSMLPGCGSTKNRDYIPPRNLAEIRQRSVAQVPTYTEVEGFPKISGKNLIPIASTNNPYIRAGQDTNEYIRLLTASNEAQYLPEFNISARSEHRRISTPVIGREGAMFRDKISSGSAEASVTQRFPWGLSGKVYVALDALDNNDMSGSSGSYGIEVEYLIPGSSRLAEQQVGDLIRLQEPARERANFTDTMRSTLAEIVSQFYGAYRSLAHKKDLEDGLMQPELLRVKSVLERRVIANPLDEKIRSDLQTLEGFLVDSSKNSASLAAELEDVRRGLAFNLGIRPEDMSKVNLTYEGVSDGLIDIPLETAVEQAITNDPTIKRSLIEIEISRARAEAADKHWDISLYAGGNRKMDDVFTGNNDLFSDEAYAGIEVTFSTSIFNPSRKELLAEAHLANARSFENRALGRIGTLTSRIHSRFQTDQKNRTIIATAEKEASRKKEAYSSASLAMENGEEWATLDRVTDLLVDWRRSQLELLEAQKDATRDKELLFVEIGRYDP
ncbi:MAG: TolC family protein [Candidatus Pacearchaeota archaeon]